MRSDARCVFMLVASAAGGSLIVSDNRLPGPPPCDTACSARLPTLPSVSKSFLTIVHNAALGLLYDPTYTRATRRYGHCPKDNCHTMVEPTGMDNIRSAIESVVSDQVDGDIVELGVWRGGLSMYAKAVLDVLGQTQRRIHLFDVFDSMSLAGYGGKNSAEFGFIALNSVAAVNNTFQRYGLLDQRVHFHEGLFNETAVRFAHVARRRNSAIAVLRIDGNFYNSYQDAMYNLYELVPVGGVVIFDDIIDHVSIQAFWKDFRRDYNLTETFVKVDRGVGWFRKSSAVRIDWSKFHTSTPHGVRMGDVTKPIGG